MTVEASREDRQAAYERAVGPAVSRLYALALAIVDDPAEAEDVVQETMISSWRRWSSLEDVANQSAWLTRVCVNHCIRLRRVLRRRILWPHERWSAAASYLPELDGRLLDLHRAYRSLSPAQRAMVTLHHHDGFTVDECAALLGCRPGTARSHLGRAMTKLRRELAHA